jgi:hypothetical protein
MTINKVLLALALAFVLAAVSNQPPAHAQDAFATMNTINTSNQLMLQASGTYDTPTPSKPKAAPQQVIVVPAGARVVYAKPKQPKFVYTTTRTPNNVVYRLVDHELGVACYIIQTSSGDGVTNSCLHIPSLKRAQ